MENKCLYCYGILSPDDLTTGAGLKEYHEKCSKKFFGKNEPPELDLTEDQIEELARNTIQSRKTVTGVQPKLSLDFSPDSARPERLTLVGLWGEYILKPQTGTYTSLPEIEDLTMHLAELSRIQTVQHTLLRLTSGQLAYLTKRIDRVKEGKLPMEDMCQLTERLTEHKYQGSYEQIVRTIKKYSANPGLNVINFYEVVLFCFLTGNSDMHLKNFSLLKKNGEYNLCPAYDLVATKLVIPEDQEEMALNLNGKKNRIKRQDFEIAMQGADIDQKVIANIFNRLNSVLPVWLEKIDRSFLSASLKEDYKALITARAARMFPE